MFIHGSGGNSNIWKEQLNIDIDYKLIALDLPSHLKSDEFEELNLDLYCAIVEELIKVLKLRKVILAGHSLGGAIVQNLYFKIPEKLLGLILIGTGGRLRVSSNILETIKYNHNKYLETLFVGAFSRFTNRKLIKEAMKEASKVSSNVTYDDFSICDKFDLLDKLHLIIVPCLIIVGTEDNLTPIKYSEFFYKKLKQSELHIITNAGHMVMIEKPNEVNTAIKNFIKKYF